LSGDWASQPISMYGRNSASGTYAYFKEHALYKGDYKNSVKEQPGSSAVVNGVANDKFAIGYSGIGYKTADVNAVALSAKEGKTPVEATLANAYSGEYPLARFLLVYVNAKPGEPLDPLRAEFIRYIFSKEGQLAVIKSGYFPVTADMANKTLESVGLGKAEATK
jgi:phosphate transport system substrate-binding protein